MKRSERLSAVLDMLGDRGRLRVEDLVEQLGVSPATARRDLDDLAEQELLRRTHGGAVAQEVAYELPLRYRKSQNSSQKDRIALAASALVELGSVVGFNGGTTSTAIALALSARRDISAPAQGISLTVVTNAINIAAQLATRPQIRTVVTGGVIHPRSYELVGPFTDTILEQVAMDVVFIGVNGMHPDVGPTVNDDQEAAANSRMANRASRTVIVADSSKIGKISLATVRTDRGSTFITDSGIGADQRSAFREAGWDLIVAD